MECLVFKGHEQALLMAVKKRREILSQSSAEKFHCADDKADIGMQIGRGCFFAFRSILIRPYVRPAHNVETSR